MGVTFMIDGGKIKIDKIGERDNNYDQFLEDLMAKDGEADDCRYAIYDYEYVVHSQGTEPSNRSRLFLVSWCPDSARFKKKKIRVAAQKISNLKQKTNQNTPPTLLLL